MTNRGWFSRIHRPQPSFAMALGMIIAIFLAVACIVAAAAQSPLPARRIQPCQSPAVTPPITPSIWAAAPPVFRAVEKCMTHSSTSTAARAFRPRPSSCMPFRITSTRWSTISLRSAPASAAIPTSWPSSTPPRAKFYEFSGMFRRDRLYSDYDLLANPNIPAGYSINNMVGGVATPALPWPQVNKSPVMFNIVRRMTDTNLTLMPFATFSASTGLLAQHHGRARAQPLLHNPEVQRAAQAVSAQRQ